MTDNTDLKRLAQRVIDIEALDGGEPIGEAWGEFEAAATPAAVLALIAENEALKGPHDWLAEDLIKELVDNAQAIQENADDGEDDPFVIVLLASASRIRRQEANIDKLRAENERLKAENAGLKTGYEAYEQVNAELKAEVEGLRKALTSSREFLMRDAKVRRMTDGSRHISPMFPLRKLVMEQIDAALGQGEQQQEAAAPAPRKSSKSLLNDFNPRGGF